MKITKNQLIDSGILRDFFNQVEQGRQNGFGVFDKDSYAERIVHNINYLSSMKRVTDPALVYLKKLKNDCVRLSKTKTHQNILQPTLEFYELEHSIGLKYCKTFRVRSKKEYKMDLFFLDLNIRVFRELPYNKRLELITEIYLIINSSRKGGNWKRSNPDHLKDRIDSVKQRLKRTSLPFLKELKNPKFKQYEINRKKDLNELTKKHSLTREQIHPLLKTPKGTERYLQNQYLMGLIQEAIKKESERLDRICILKLCSIMDELKVKNHSETLNKIRADREFMNAFPKF